MLGKADHDAVVLTTIMVRLVYCTVADCFTFGKICNLMTELAQVSRLC